MEQHCENCNQTAAVLLRYMDDRLLCVDCWTEADRKPEDFNRPRIIYTAGVWDLLHRGHLNFLWESRQLGDMLVVGVVSDAGCHAYKGEFPAENSQHRLRMIQNLGFVDVAEIQQTTDPSDQLERYRPDMMTHGDDWMHLKEGHETLDRLGIEWKLIPYTAGISSTELRDRRNEKD